MTTEEPCECACGETDIEKHDLGMVISHTFDLSMQEGRDILVRIRDRAGVETADEDRVFPDALTEKDTDEVV